MYVYSLIVEIYHRVTYLISVNISDTFTLFIIRASDILCLWVMVMRPENEVGAGS